MHFPAKTMLIAAMNPCPCGYLGDSIRACTCAESAITRYSRRVSGPILDRIDMYVHVPRVDYDKLAGREKAEPSSRIRSRVKRARAVQASRFVNTSMVTNADMGPAELATHCILDETAKRILHSAATQMGLSARGYHRVLKLSRTIADLSDSHTIEVAHVAEALQYRARGPAAGSDGAG